MTGAGRSAGNVIRKIIAAIILVPLAVIIVAFAVANRQIVTVSLDPFSAEHPAALLTLPLFALIIVLLVIGILIGGMAAWLRQSKWRRAARRLERELQALKRTPGIPGGSVNAPAETPERLQLRPPMR